MKRIKILANETILENLENIVSAPWRKESSYTEKCEVSGYECGS